MIKSVATAVATVNKYTQIQTNMNNQYKQKKPLRQAVNGLSKRFI